MITLAIILFAASIVLAYMAMPWGAPVAYAAMVLMSCGSPYPLPTWDIVFWAIATVLVLGAAWLQRPVAGQGGTERRGTAYVVTATMAGMLVGLLLKYEAAMIVGAVAGAFLGALAYSRTPAGHELQFPSARFMQYLTAKGLTAVVTMSMLGLGISLLLYVNV